MQPLTCPACGTAASLRLIGPQSGDRGQAFIAAACSDCSALVNLSLLAQGPAGTTALARRLDLEAAPLSLYGRDFALRVAAEQSWLSDLVDTCAPRMRGDFCDFGAGASLLGLAATDLFDRTHAVDLSLINARTLNAFAVDAGRKPVSLHSSVATLAGPMDFIVLRNVVRYLFDLPETLRTLTACLAPGGVLVILETAPGLGLAEGVVFTPGAEGLGAILNHLEIGRISMPLDREGCWVIRSEEGEAG